MLKKALQNEPQTASIPVSFAKLYREANQAQLNFNRTRHCAGFVVSEARYGGPFLYPRHARRISKTTEPFRGELTGWSV
jgi:hypothetical protein